MAVSRPVVTEVLAGARSKRREADLQRLLLRFDILVFEPVTDSEAGVAIYRRCRSAGITPRGLLDCMISAVAWRCGVTLLSHDVDLDRVAGVIGLTPDEACLRA
ncbi:MAG: PIN domain-containing protein [Ornithinimicrobium sp.]